MSTTQYIWPNATKERLIEYRLNMLYLYTSLLSSSIEYKSRIFWLPWYPSRPYLPLWVFPPVVPRWRWDRSVPASPDGTVLMAGGNVRRNQIKSNTQDSQID